MDDERRCKQCGVSLEDRRSDAEFCRQKCKRRYYRKPRSSYYEPPLPGTSNVRAEVRADRSFHDALASQAERSQPLTAAERELLATQRRNPGVLLPELRERLLQRAYAQRAAEEAEAFQVRPIRVEDPLDPGTIGSMALRAQQSRRGGTTRDPNEYLLRPLPGPPVEPWGGEEPEMIDAPWSRGR